MEKRNVLIGVTGGIAIYKILDLISKLRKDSFNVKVIMTENATKFISPLTFQTLSQNEVHTEMFHQRMNMNVEHISLAKWADVFVIAPATANTIAKIAHGIGDNMLTTVALAYNKKMLIIPAMNSNMLDNRVTFENIERLKSLGHIVTETQVDRLACGDIGKGKMIEPKQIMEYIKSSLTVKTLKNKRIIVTAGPTSEPLDPVRYITNYSSGKMGYSIAEEASRRGAEVILISGTTSLTPPKVYKNISVTTTNDMFEAIKENFSEADVLIKAAAPADFTPLNYSEKKIKKQNENKMELDLEKTVDIANYFGHKKKDNQIVVGFAAESDNVEDYAKSKLVKKNLDFIVANNILQKGAGFRSDTNIAKIIEKNGVVEDLDKMSKSDLAKIILDKIEKILSEK